MLTDKNVNIITTIPLLRCLLIILKKKHQDEMLSKF